jgi:hypothetical protein
MDLENTLPCIFYTDQKDEIGTSILLTITWEDEEEIVLSLETGQHIWVDKQQLTAVFDRIGFTLKEKERIRK